MTRRQMFLACLAGLISPAAVKASPKSEEVRGVITRVMKMSTSVQEDGTFIRYTYETVLKYSRPVKEVHREDLAAVRTRGPAGSQIYFHGHRLSPDGLTLESVVKYRQRVK